ncbi:transferrin-like isoform X2 [Daktulosphaira vitifoliae]|uniref:transferrin-like isoform X2 n=1 Tax=Daktulosphaira vitifoliae TaxID=58002 RepID=UPI0021AAD0AB|nr:transferrin-like isoform X2 [Daktulosphaira vitifoliae]
MNYLVFIISIALLPILPQADTKFKLCVIPSLTGNDRTQINCPILSQNPNSQVECVFANDKTHCIRKLLDGNADFGVFKAEEISYASQWNDLLSVTNEIRSIENDNYEYNMVVLVNDAANINSLDDLYDKRLCHPGFSDTDDGIGWSDLISQYFEKIVVPQKCDPKLSIVENQLRSMSEFFDLSCKPGQWDPNPDIDSDLKTKYPSLCANCKNPLSCNSNDQFWGRQGALTCLNEGFGDIAWARLSDVKLQFKVDDSNVFGKINFLCPNGTTQQLNSTNPCAWISRPWPAIISRKSMSKNVQDMVNYAITAEEMKNVSSWQWSLKNLLIHYSDPIVSRVIKSPNEYLSVAPGYLKSQNKNHNCGKREFSLCVENIEAYNKCQTLSDISVAYGIEPKMNCIEVIDCAKLLENGHVDIMIIDADTLASYKRHYKTKNTILFTTSLYHRVYRKVSAVMLKKKFVKHFEQLKGKIGCFPSFDGFAWNSFLMTAKLHKLELFPNNDTIKHFFSNSCAIISTDHNSIPTCEFDDIIPEESKKNGLLSEILALRCIIDGGGDVAFINTFHLSQYLAQIILILLQIVHYRGLTLDK